MDPHHTSSYSYTTGLQSGTGAAAPGSYTTGTTPGLHYSGTYGTTGTTPGLSYSYTQETGLLKDSPLRKSIAAGDIGITTQPASYTSSSYTTPAATAGLSGSHHYTTTAPASYTATTYTTAPVISSTYTTTAESPLKRSYTVTDTAAPGGYTASTGETAKRSGAGLQSSGTYGTTGTTGTSGTYTAGTYGTYNPTTSYTVTSTNPTSYTAPASYTATTQSYTAPSSYTVAPQTDSYHKSTPYLDSLFSGLRQSAVHEVKANVENKHLESTLQNQYPTSSTHSQGEVLDILKQYGLVSQDRLNDPHKVWQQINPTPEVHSYTSGLYTNLPPSTTQTTSYTTPSSYTSTYTAQPTSYTSTYTPASYTATTTQPASYTSTYTPAATSYTATTTQPASYTSAYTSSYVPTSTITGSAVAVTPSTPTKSSGIDVTVKRGAEADKQSRTYQSVPIKSSQVVPRESLLSPYRHSMYPEFELVEDLPNRSNLIDSINTFLQRSPAKESLLVSPSRVSIKRKSLLSPADIEFTSLFKEKYEDGSIYEGEGKAGRRHGKGRLTFKDGRTLQGNFRDGRAEGNATVYFRNGKVCYEGGVDDAVYHGQGVLQCETPIPLQGAFDSSNFGNLGNHWTRYEGEFNRGKRYGKGTIYLSNGERFTGEFRDDKVHGQGSFQTRDGRTVQGVWENNVLRR